MNTGENIILIDDPGSLIAPTKEQMLQFLTVVLPERMKNDAVPSIMIMGKMYQEDATK